MQRKARGPEKPVRGFEHIMRYWDNRCGHWAAKVLPGEFYVSRNEELIVTVLGSCVAACIHDPVLKVGGMNHFMLPEGGDDESYTFRGGVSSATRYGTHAMESLLNQLSKLGVERGDMQIKLFGAGKILKQLSDVGKHNAEFVREFLANERLTIAAEDLGGPHPRKVVFWAHTGRVQVKRLSRLDTGTIAHRETSYLQDLGKDQVGGQVELF
jgi:chemotaxis protein CheD